MIKENVSYNEFQTFIFLLILSHHTNLSDSSISDNAISFLGNMNVQNDVTVFMQLSQRKQR